MFRRRRTGKKVLMLLHPNANLDLLTSDIQNLRSSNYNFWGELTHLKHCNTLIGNIYDEEIIKLMKNRKEILAIEEDIKISIKVPEYGTIKQASQEIPWGIKKIEAEKAWPYAQGKGVRVGILDTGIDLNHFDLKGNIKGGVNILSPNRQPRDDNGHGTHIAGTIGAVNNDYGVVGIAPQADLYAIKAFDRNGRANLSDIIRGINWAIDNKIQVLNMSFGFSEQSSIFSDAIRKAYNKGIVLVAASGNDGKNGTLDYPAQFNEVIAVSATTKEDTIAKYSNTGPNVDLAAPGDKIYSTWPGNSFRELSGTSMATGHVTGAVVLLLGQNRNISNEQVRRILNQGANPIKNVSPYAQGAGIVRVSTIIKKSN